MLDNMMNASSKLYSANQVYNDEIINNILVALQQLIPRLKFKRIFFK